MERLTGRFKDGRAFILPSVVSQLSPMKSEIIEKLAEYEDAEEQGMLLRLPCKVGTKVYAINRIIDYGEVGDEATYSYSIIEREFQIYMMMDYGKLVFGKTVFLTREEAEKALADMGV